MKRLLSALLISITAAISLAGCSLTDPVTAAASIGTLVHTDKTITDHFVSWAMAKGYSNIGSDTFG